eukprot:15202885-Ditylum_brightwellii.AAC.1
MPNSKVQSARARAKAWSENQFEPSLPTKKQNIQRAKVRAKKWSETQFQKRAPFKTSITIQKVPTKEEEK